MILKHTKNRHAFTMIELVFVIIVMGIIGKFGVEFLARAYESFIYSKINNQLQSNSATAVEFVSTRLQRRIKASTIARETNATLTPQFTLLSDYYKATAPILEWVGVDVEGFRGESLPYWSGIIDLNQSVSTTTRLYSPRTDTVKINTLIQVLSNDITSGMSDAAIYFVNPDALASADGWGWDANTTAFDVQSNVQIHPVVGDANGSNFVPVRSNGVANNFDGVYTYEFYQLAWTAYAVGIVDFNNTGNGTGTLTMWYNYQPWKGEKYTDGNSATVMNNVSSFRFIASDSLVKIQVCVKSDLIKDEEYSICKEKTVF